MVDNYFDRYYGICPVCNRRIQNEPGNNLAQARQSIQSQADFAQETAYCAAALGYFDTADRALAAAGMSLPIRQVGEHRTQTMNAAGARATGLFVRSAWEIPVQTDVPVIDDKTPVQALLGDVLDRGTITAGDRQTPVCEMDLKAGPPEALPIRDNSTSVLHPMLQ